MPKDTAKALDSLPKLSAAELRSLWVEAFGRPLAFRVQKDLLVRLLAYRLQEQVHGGPRPVIVKRLQKLVREFAHSDRAPDCVDAPRFKRGTRLIREWQGKTYEVTVMDRGFAWRGHRYESLSEIAREITGARWSGPRFFGLNKTAIKEGVPEAQDGR
jgi:Protein of unknown function (DUF2924)